MNQAIINYMLGGRLTFCLLILLLCVAYLSLLLGGTIESFARLIDITFGQGVLMENIIIWQIRAPRIVLAALTGFALGLVGAAIQGLLRNPLAEPALLGASNSAALGAVIIIYLGLSGTLSFAVPLVATLCALASVGLLFLLVGQRADTIRLILAGFAVSAFAGAGIALALNLSPNFFAALEIAFWLLGSVENRSWQHVMLALPPVLFGTILLLSGGRGLDALALGEETAASLGIRLTYLRWRLVGGMALAVGGTVAVVGVISFVGLIAPHVIRPFTGGVPSRCLLPSAFVGALMLVLADSLIRVIPTQVELKLGVVTAFIGVPIFLFLLLRARHFVAQVNV